jgi:replication factor C large subunit
MNEPWISKYQPKSLATFGTYKEQLVQMQQFVVDFKRQKKKGMLLHGPTGCGKTAAVYALASDCNFELIEVNASDVRKKDAMLALLGTAAKQRSLFSQGKIILVDEVDCVSGVKDRGAVGAIEKVIAETSYPIFLACQDVGSKKIKSLVRKVQCVAFDPLDHTTIFSILSSICSREGIDFDEAAVKTLARQSDGDLRAAINDLQSVAQERGRITMESLDALGYRNKKESIEDALIKIFKVKNANVAKDALRSVHEDLDKVMLWVDHNLPKEYKDPASLVRAYNALSKADVYKGRIRRWQHWRFLVYVNALVSAGVAVAKDERNKEVVTYERTKRLLKIWMANQKYAKRKAIAAKIAAGTHTGVKQAVKNTVPYLQTIFKHNKKMGAVIAAEFELDPDEVKWLER